MQFELYLSGLTSFPPWTAWPHASCAAASWGQTTLTQSQQDSDSHSYSHSHCHSHSYNGSHTVTMSQPGWLLSLAASVLPSWAPGSESEWLHFNWSILQKCALLGKGFIALVPSFSSHQVWKTMHFWWTCGEGKHESLDSCHGIIISLWSLAQTVLIYQSSYPCIKCVFCFCFSARRYFCALQLTFPLHLNFIKPRKPRNTYHGLMSSFVLRSTLYKDCAALYREQ